ncbi:carbohydrate ABC transporter permease [uncultured Cellulomonas sp.]|uniref:carbohydrate ABC transporter permease n=1 Tax=uncultured Cellulomonas sp. TaxID=189682 RepID=UPI0026019348|nr:carbohydrate ABC transporter permease [uncultured Cellulomonas sp.]
MVSQRKTRTGARAALWVAILAATIYSAFPFYWLFISSITDPSQLFGGALVPSDYTLDNYAELFAQTAVLTWMRNSVVVAVVVTVATVVVAVMGAYSLAFFGTRLGQAAGQLILFTYMFPGVVIVVPAYRILSQLGLVDSIVGIVLVELVLTVPFCVWMLRSFFKEIPKELFEAGRMDGASHLRVLWSIMVPVARPGIIAIAVFAFIFSWNEYLFPLVLVNSEDGKTLPIGVAGFMGNLTVQWGPLLASGVVTVLPVLVLFVFLQRYLVQGLMAGAVKG